jgi:hypothetical protein
VYVNIYIVVMCVIGAQAYGVSTEKALKVGPLRSVLLFKALSPSKEPQGD